MLIHLQKKIQLEFRLGSCDYCWKEFQLIQFQIETLGNSKKKPYERILFEDNFHNGLPDLQIGSYQNWIGLKGIFLRVVVGGIVAKPSRNHKNCCRKLLVSNKAVVERLEKLSIIELSPMEKSFSREEQIR